MNNNFSEEKVIVIFVNGRENLRYEESDEKVAYGNLGVLQDCAAEWGYPQPFLFRIPRAVVDAFDREKAPLHLAIVAKQWEN